MDFSSEFLTKKIFQNLSWKSLLSSSTFLFLAVKFTEAAIAARIFLQVLSKPKTIKNENEKS